MQTEVRKKQPKKKDRSLDATDTAATESYVRITTLLEMQFCQNGTEADRRNPSIRCAPIAIC